MGKINTLSFILRFYFWFFITKCLILYFWVVKPKRCKKDVLYLESLTLDGAGYTYRVKHWLSVLNNNGLIAESLCVIPDAKTFFKESTPEQLPNFILKNIRIRIKQIIYSRQFKCVIVRRNLVIYNQYGNHFMEKLMRAAQPNCILDFDDDIGADEQANTGSAFDTIMQTTSQQFYLSFRYFNGFICGTTYLKDLLLSHHKTDNFEIIPTCVNYTNYQPKLYNKTQPKTITFGWIGGNYNLFLLEQVIPHLNQISLKTSIQLLIVSGVHAYPFEANFPIIFEQFSLETEKEHIRKMDFGLMPLRDDEVSRGKCGFKLLQYMGLGVPGLASAVTVNNQIIEDCVNGWLISNPNQWTEKLEAAITSYPEIQNISRNALNTVHSRYTFKANANIYSNFVRKNSIK